jgi:nucleoside-diphosphate-sugar epimerase
MSVRNDKPQVMEDEIVGQNFIARPEDQLLITGAAGFIGSRLLRTLLDYGFRKVRVLVRPSSDTARLKAVISHYGAGAEVQILEGNLQSREYCTRAVEDVAVIFHLAAGMGEKSFPAAFMDSVVTTRNLLDAVVQARALRRFVNISSFTVYSNVGNPKRRILDENCALELHPECRGDAYAFAKVKQDQIVAEYSEKHGIPFVTVRPGAVLGAGRRVITGRVGIDTFGVFLHMGGQNPIPFTYVDNCAELIALAGLKPGVDGEVFNAVDDDLPTSRQFLRMYKRHVRSFKSLYVPHLLSYGLCYVWEKYSDWSEGQLPPAFTRRRWHTDWKMTRYSNTKAKTKLGWTPRVPMAEGLKEYFEDCCQGGSHS